MLNFLILILISISNLMLSLVKHEFFFITSGPGEESLSFKSQSPGKKEDSRVSLISSTLVY